MLRPRHRAARSGEWVFFNPVIFDTFNVLVGELSPLDGLCLGDMKGHIRGYHVLNCF